MKKTIFAVIYSIILIAFTVYLAMDTFVIPRPLDVVPSETITRPMPTTEIATTTIAVSEKETTEEFSSEVTTTEEVTTEEPTSSYISTENEFYDGNIHIELKQFREHNTEIYVADVTITNPDFLKTAFARSTYGLNITQATSTMAKANNAILAINGDFYGVRKVGYVIRGGVLYRDIVNPGCEDLCIYTDGSFGIIKESAISAQKLLAKGVYDLFNFGPVLMIDGKITVNENSEVFNAMATNPRTAIAYVEPLHYLFIVSDGRSSESVGLSLYELAQFGKSLGAKTMYNLDGGGSSTMYFNGKVINKPTANGKTFKERSVSDIVYIGY